jgi:two-component system cell cycle sensor histidine kinase/response regulator CckA
MKGSGHGFSSRSLLRSLVSSSQGTGLGLAIVYGIVEQCGGHIQVSIQLGQGTIFTIFLHSSDELEHQTAPPVQSSCVNPGIGVILLAEDHEPLRKLLISVLKSAGYEVLPARDGAQALDMAAAELSRIDLVVTDIDMPVVSGMELMECLWTLDPKLSVLYMSGHAVFGEQITRGH